MLGRNSFVRVREDHPSQKAGMDAQVLEDMGREGIALLFGFNRHCQFQDHLSVGPEIWYPWELDLASIEPEA